METSKKQKVVAGLKTLETGVAPPDYLNPEKYVQHNLMIESGPEGIGKFMANLPKDTLVETVRVFQDGDYVFAHSKYNFFGPKIGFDVFRFEDGRVVEHWDNLQETVELTPSGHTMIDGETEVKDLELTETNRALVNNLLKAMLDFDMENYHKFFDNDKYIQHTPGSLIPYRALSAR